ncbi:MULTISPECIES: TIGR02449 family protein [Gammaproteobacteria]|jgi:cell division protein ZapB|uniref:TIGR02449 family protein n=2 Tax=Halomonadaceae TaxID=28256 RepID=A0A2A2F9H4_9GAMM|nr:MULTISPECIES: TIGR02449 family protein [Gammaproteobacteria]KAA8983608.1 TIGR02449 family protein [Halospina sp. K52047b]MYL27305.1 TIGR02449 family protein [Halomonas utahensis]MYL75984.1 TIGR02449 family protein [Halomonas sp. 22501_18_FS]PAU81608.1 TIGR02449 family protein [Halovibrio salipaludis]
MDQAELEALAARIERLIERNRQLEAENARLRQAQEDWQQERVQLMQKNDMARHRIEAMISRLRSLEHH